MLKLLILIVFIVTIGIYSCYANPKWKRYEKSEKYGNILVRGIIGLAAWTVIFGYLVGYIKKESYSEMLIIASAIVIILLAAAGFRLIKDGYKPIYPVWLLLTASMGGWARFVFNCTLIGIPVMQFLKTYAQMGEEFWEEWMSR